MKILIPNATGPTNIGDQAIFHGLLLFINKKYPEAEIIIQSSDPELYENTKYKIKPHLYFWSVFEKPQFLTRISRTIQLFIGFIGLKFNINCGSLISDKLTDILNDYKKSDLIIFVGGGYLRSQKGFTQSLNVLMTLSLFCFGKIYKGKAIVAPMSFGPFANKWQEKLSAYVLRDLKTVMVREDFSYAVLKKYKIKNLINSYDLALLLDKVSIQKTHDKPLLGFTIRPWRKPQEQRELENCFAEAIEKFYKLTYCRILPIIQVKGIDDDLLTTESVIEILTKKGVSVLEPAIINDIEQAKQIYSSLDLMLGMRMHSNIIAATQGIPFVSISYEYKTEGIAKYLGMSEYSIKQQEVNSEKLFASSQPFI